MVLDPINQVLNRSWLHLKKISQVSITADFLVKKEKFMKLFKYLLMVLLVVVSFVFAQPSLADPNLTKTTDYTEVTQALDSFLQAKDAPDESEYTPEQIQQKIGELQFQKYILETAENWAQCRNETGKTLAIYAHKPKKSAESNTLYYLANGEVTDDDWNCDGVYLPEGTKVAGLIPTDTQDQELAEPVAVKIISGTQLIAKANPETGVVEFNLPPAKVFKAGEINWSIPTMSQADIDANIPNAPIDD